MKKNIEQNKMSIEEYQQKYTHPENIKTAKTFLFVLGVAIGVVVATALFFVVLRLFEIHVIAGYVGIFGAVLVFVLGYLVPVIKLKNMKAFMTNVTGANARQAQRYNKRMREDIADKMIDIADKTQGVSWYSDKLLGKLAVARHTRNDKDLKSALTEIYKVDVNKAANKLIAKSALNTGLITAISQSELMDTLTVIVYQLNLIKDIVFLYGFRPTETQMVKIYKNVLVSALAAHGVNTISKPAGKAIGATISTIFGGLTGGVLSTIIDSGLQGAVNSAFTSFVGSQTKLYLVKEYRLQEILDNVQLIDNEKEAQQIAEINAEVTDKLLKKIKKEKVGVATV